MTQEEKQLLLKDLCARLPYGVMYETEYGPRIINDLFIYSNGPVYTDHNVGDYNEVYGIELGHIKPYLRPMSSMTDEEEVELNNILPCGTSFSYTTKGRLIIYTDPEYDCDYSFSSFVEIQDWLNANYFDYRGLIPMGLALEAPDGMYRNEQNMEIPNTQTLNLSDAERFCIGLKMLAKECKMKRIEYNLLGVQMLHFADGSSVGELRAYINAGLLTEI